MNKKFLKVILISFILCIGLIANRVKADNRIVSSFENTINASYNGYETQNGTTILRKSYSNSVQSGKAFCTSFWLPAPAGTCTAVLWNSNATTNKKIAIAVGNMISKARNLSQTGDGTLTWEVYFYSEMAINKFLYDYNGKNANNNVTRLNNWGKISSNSKYQTIYAAGVTAYNNYGKSTIKFTNPSISVDGATVTVTATLTCYDPLGKAMACSIQNNNNDITIKAKEGDSAEIVKTVTPTVTKNGANLNYNYTGHVTFEDAFSETTQITATLNSRTKIGYAVAQNYNCGNSYQSLTPNSIKPLYEFATATKTLGKREVYCSIELKKVDSENSALALKGAKFELYSDQGGTNKIDTATSNINGILTFDGLAPGTYYYREKTAPTGYIVDSTMRSITLAESGGVCAKTENVTNVKRRGSITIKKTDGNGNFVSGAKIKVYTTTSSELISPENINLEDGNGEYSINDSSNYGFKFLHFDANGNYNENGEYDYFISDGNPKTIDNLTVGETYYIYESDVPENSDYAVKVGADYVEMTEAKNYIVELINNHSKFKISKQDITSKKELPGATLQILDSRDIKIYEWVSTKEQKEILGLEDGNYTLVEITAPNGYQKAESISFTIKDGKLENNADNTLVMYDDTEKFPVPDTLSARNIVIILTGLGIVGAGVGIFVYGVKKKDKI